MSSVDTEELVEAYIALRTERDILLRQYESNDEALKTEMSKLEAALLDVCNAVNADSIKTAHGTVMRKLSERFFCQDWDNFYNFVLQNEAPHLLERRIHQSNFKEFFTRVMGYPPVST